MRTLIAAQFCPNALIGFWFVIGTSTDDSLKIEPKQTSQFVFLEMVLRGAFQETREKRIDSGDSESVERRRSGPRGSPWSFPMVEPVLIAQRVRQ